MARDTYIPETVSSFSTAFAVGSFQSAFELQLFKNPQFSDPIREGNNVYIGSSVFVNFAWIDNTEALSEKVNFFINSCHVSEGELSIPIVKKSCFASAVSATYLSTQKLVSESSRFSFRRFIIIIYKHYLKSPSGVKKFPGYPAN